MKSRDTKATILIVDDEPLLRWSLKEQLSPTYNVILADSGEEALRQLDHGRPIDLLVTDLRLDAMDGITLIEKARRLRPALAAMIMTAYDSDENIERAHRSGVTRIVTKPFEAKAMKAAIASEMKPPPR